MQKYWHERRRSNVENYRLVGSTLYVTIEPASCVLAPLFILELKRLYLEHWNPKLSNCKCKSIARRSLYEYKVEYEGGVLADECSALISKFFAMRRSEERRKAFKQASRISNKYAENVVRF